MPGCKVGDLAVIVGVHPYWEPLRGRFVIVVRPYNDEILNGSRYFTPFPGQVWVIRAVRDGDTLPESDSSGFFTRQVPMMPCTDCCLQPIRDNDGVDEMLKNEIPTPEVRYIEEGV